MVNRKKIVLAIVFFFFLFLVTEAKAEEKTEFLQLNAFYYHNNNPIYSIQIQATNYETAYEKIKNGNFEDEDFEHYSLDELRKRYKVDGNVVELTESLSFGTGQSLTKDDADTVLTALYRDARGYLEYLNEFEKTVILHNPANARYSFTDEQGLSIGTVKKGKTIVSNSADKEFQLLELNQAEETVYLGNTEVNSKSVTLDAHLTSKKYSADIGESITYRINLENINHLEIELSPHFVVESVNANYEEKLNFTRESKGEAGSLKFSKSVPSNTSLTDNGFIVTDRYTDETKKDLKNFISTLQSSRVLEVDLDSINEQYLEIKGHVSSSFSYQVEVILEDGSSETETYQVENQNIQQGIFVKADGKYLLTPEIYSYNINFVMIDGSLHKLLTGSKYILGRFNHKGNVSVLEMNEDNELIWSSLNLTSDNLENAESNFAISGNQILYLDGYKTTIPLNKNIWAYDEEKQKESNSSLFKLRGLSNAYTYFIKQVSAPKGYEISNQVEIFQLSTTSESQAQFSDYQVNGYILDFEYGNTEYNVLASIKVGQKATRLIDPMVFTLGFIISVIAIVSGVSYFVIKRG